MACLCQRRSLRAVELDPTVARRSRWVKTTPSRPDPKTLAPFRPVLVSVSPPWRLDRAARHRRRPMRSTAATVLLFLSPPPLLCLSRMAAASGEETGAPLAPLPACACTHRCAHHHQAAQRRCPVTVVVLSFPRLGVVLRPVLRLADMHWDREERVRPETAAHFSGEPEALSGEFFLFPFCSL
jgi:hypothetical protein